MEFRTRFITEEDKEKIRLAVQLHTPVEVMSYTLPREMETYIQEVLLYFLEASHQEHMVDNLVFCLGELLTNAKKANTKRVYFTEQKLDINSDMDYHTGMISFKNDMLNNLAHYLKLQKDAGLYVKFRIQLYDEGIKIEIINNSVLTIFEKKRINEKLKVANKYNEPSQVISRVVDQTEGAGLGIIIMVLMLQKIGLSKENFKIYSTDTETITQMILPLNAKINKEMDSLYEQFTEVLDTVPVFEESIKEYSELAQKADTKDQQLIDFISKDVLMATVLLKSAAAKGLSCSKITEAYKALGKAEVNALFSKDSPSSVIRLIQKEKRSSSFWQHEKDVAFYAYNLAKNLPQVTCDFEEIYTCGLLHDIECLLLEVATEEQKASVKKIADTIEDGDKLYDLFLKDFGHSRGCYMLAQKWGLPERIAQVIRYHNKPETAPEEIKELIYVVYLADILQYYQLGQVEFYQLNKTVLDYFKIDSKKALDYIAGQLKNAGKNS